MEVKKAVIDYICEYINTRRNCAISVLGGDSESTMILIYKDITQAELDDAVDVVGKEVIDEKLMRYQIENWVSNLGKTTPVIMLDDNDIIIKYGKHFKIDYAEPKCFEKIDKLLAHLLEFNNLYSCIAQSDGIKTLDEMINES